MFRDPQFFLIFVEVILTRKGFGYIFDHDLIGNGRFCWNCFARLHYDPDTYQTSAAYDNCFEGGKHAGFMEMCVGEEYFCSWEERRYKVSMLNHTNVRFKRP